MHWDRTKFFVIASVCVFGLLAAAWLAGGGFGLSDPALDEHQLVVAATIFPLADMVEQVAGEDVGVVLIVPPGASPHSYDLRPQQVVGLERTQVIFHIGEGLDDAVVERVLGAASGVSETEAYAVHDGIALQEFHEEAILEEEGEDEHGHADSGLDPHYWLTAPNAKIMVGNIHKKLAEIDPAHADTYADRAAKYMDELDVLDADLRAEAGGMTQKSFIAQHNAWSYFAQEYGLKLVGTYEPIEGREPSPQDIRALQAVVVEHGLRAFYAEPQKASTSATQFFRDELGLTIRVLVSEGSTSVHDSYINLMRANMEAIAFQ